MCPTHSRGSALLGAWLNQCPIPSSLSRRVWSRGGRGWPAPGSARAVGRPARCAQLCGTHTRSPVLTPWLLRSWTMSWVRPGQRPALSTPMFPGDPGPIVPWAASGPSPDAPRHPFLERGRAVRRMQPPTGSPVPGPRRRFRLPGSRAGRQCHLLAVRNGCAAAGAETSPRRQGRCAPAPPRLLCPEAPRAPGRKSPAGATCTRRPHSPLPASQTRTQTYLDPVVNPRPASVTSPRAQGTYLLVRARPWRGMKSIR